MDCPIRLDIEKAAALAQASHGLRPRSQHAEPDCAGSAVALGKCQKVLKRGGSPKRVASMARFQRLFEQFYRQEIRLVYIDPAQIHRDMELGYTWTTKNKIAWRMSDSAPLSNRINWYGAYEFGAGQCFIWN
jgi:hypothetical protein